ncbi:MAG: hypothetical protein GXP09_07810 [Gammaproteobacteria bacterium]|nr:hypothetical protein [Gammaproteobacteria bacterium]
MVGKKNIVFGFIYLVFTAALGPVMILNYVGDVNSSRSAKQIQIGDLQNAVDAGFELDLDPMSADTIAKQNSLALLSLSAYLNSQEPINAIKGGPHSHGNLEAMLNIVVGLMLCLVAVTPLLKQIISWLFIIGTLGHSGLLYLAVGLEQAWAGSLLIGPVGYVGPSLILIGLLLAGVAAAIGFRGTPVED